VPVQLTLTSHRFYSPFMVTLTIQLPPQRAQTEFNLRRWAELLADRELARFEGRIETDRYGHIIMSPPPAPRHGSYQSEIAHLLRTLRRGGRVYTECPISTADGVKAADVVWASAERVRDMGNAVCFPRSPEICVEVLSPGNTEAEIHEKTALDFDAGAKEVWICGDSGEMTFFQSGDTEPRPRSDLCPDFPSQAQLRSLE
jgi:Uma2 family endonuclease